MEFVRAPASEFVMGDWVAPETVDRLWPGGKIEWYRRSHPQHRVPIRKEFLSARNVESAYKSPFGPRGRRWLSQQNLGPAGNWQRDDLVRRLEHFEIERARLDAHLVEQARAFPDVEALTAL